MAGATKSKKYVVLVSVGKDEDKEEYDVHACLAAAAKPNVSHCPRQRITMKRLQKRGSDKELRR